MSMDQREQENGIFEEASWPPQVIQSVVDLGCATTTIFLFNNMIKIL